jgi:hypothetical protein
MKRYSLIGLFATTVVGLSLLSHNALGQQKSLEEQLVGTWTLASTTDQYEDGHTGNAWGPIVKGALSFDGKGHYIYTIIGGDLSPQPPSSAPPISKRNVVTYFGTYSVDEAASTVTYTADRGTESVFDGVPRKASVTLNGSEEMVQTLPVIKLPTATWSPRLVWKRATQ